MTIKTVSLQEGLEGIKSVKANDRLYINENFTSTEETVIYTPEQFLSRVVYEKFPEGLNMVEAIKVDGVIYVNPTFKEGTETKIVTYEELQRAKDEGKQYI